MNGQGARPLHLHTVESLCADLISGRSIAVGVNSSKEFSLATEHAKAVLQWYAANRAKWGGNIYEKDYEAIVDSISVHPRATPTVTFSNVGRSKHVKLKSLKAHRFAGLHRFRSVADAPEDFELDFKSVLTFLEGANGAGKTSILNAVVWALTGQVFRPQRPPELGQTEFECSLTPEASDLQPETFKLAAVVPLPDLEHERPTGQVDTWVELVFEDEDGVALPAVRRQLARNNKGKLVETEPGLAALGLDEVVTRSGTLMAGLLPYIQFEGPSALGKAVAELTGLAPLVQLAKHATKSSEKLKGDGTKARQNEITRLDLAYSRARQDLLSQIEQNETLTFSHTLPEASGQDVEPALALTKSHFDLLSATRLAEAGKVLGESYDASREADRRSLQDSIGPALADLDHLKSLPSANRLSALGAVSVEQREEARRAIENVLRQAAELVRISLDPTRAGRLRLYAAVGSWMETHPDFNIEDGRCPVCDASLDGLVDEETGLGVSAHLKQALHDDAALVAKTLVQWAKSAANELVSQLPPGLQLEAQQDLPEHPSHLMTAALGTELWQGASYKGVLAVLQEPTAIACEQAVAKLVPLPKSGLPNLEAALPGLSMLQQTVLRLDRAIRFSEWRAGNVEAMRSVVEAVVGRSKDFDGLKTDSLAAKLHKLRVIVESVEPIKQAVQLCGRMSEDYAQRKSKTRRIELYQLTAEALIECSKLGTLAEAQVEALQRTLHEKTVEWRNRIYQGAWPATNLELVGLNAGSDGRFEFKVGTSGVTAPAQHVSNASALRASLIGFFLAYWQYLQTERGGLRLLVLDDPQELLDGENRHRLADSLAYLAADGTQLVVTTHDKPFAELLVQSGRVVQVPVDHRSVHPPSAERPTLQTCPSVLEVQRLHEAILKDENDAVSARDYVAECRVFIETRLGDFFDTPAYQATSATTASLPTLADFVFRLKGAVRPPVDNELFRSPVLRELAADPGLQVSSPTFMLLNRAHHRQKHLIQPSDVKSARADLERLRRLVERAHEQLRLFLRRERLPSEFDTIEGLQPGQVPEFSISIQPNLLAYVRGAATGDSQELSAGTIDQTWFEDKAFFYLRTQNFGFASTVSSVAIVEAVASPVADRQLVIARRGKDVYARRLLRPDNSEYISLASETPDPRLSRQTLQFHHREVALHRVVGMFFHVDGLSSRGREEAVQVDGTSLVEAVRSAFKVEEQSAIPLALEGQVALGSTRLGIGDFDSHIERLVALNLDDGTSIFKRIGSRLGAGTLHLRQFDAIGGLGAADVLAVGEPQPGFRTVESAILISGILYL